MGEVLIATSGYSYDDWKGVFYPEGLPKSDYLRYYALFFPFVELEFPHYAMPTRKNLESMAARTPAHFGFSIKAHRSLTHEPGPGWRDDAATFAKAAGALADAGKLLAVLVQLPFRFHHTPDNRSFLASLLDALRPLPLIVEFRNDEWNGERVLEELNRRGVGLAMIDRPTCPVCLRSRTALPVGWHTCASMAAMPTPGGPATRTRYDYLYSRDELESAAPRLRRMAKQGQLLVAFNNHPSGYAVRNANELKKIISLW